jgi:DNA-binding NarL/FixJ family response regulator
MRILIVDDNERVRSGVAKLLSAEADWEVCGEAGDGESGLQKARQLLPELILLDISMPGLGGLETASLLRRELPGAKILMLSQHDPVHFLPGAIAAGAQGCVDKSRLSTDLVAAIKRVSMGPNPSSK